MRYASIPSWVEHFKNEEDISISVGTIRNRLSAAEVIGKNYRNNIGRILQNAYYSEADVRRVCGDLLQEFPPIDEHGFFEKGGEKWGHIFAWSHQISINYKVIKRRIERSKTCFIEGRDGMGRITNCYSEADVRRVCGDLLQEFPPIDEHGFFEKNGEKWGTIMAWDRQLPIGSNSIKRRLGKTEAAPLKNKDARGRMSDYYSETQVHMACADLLYSHEINPRTKANPCPIDADLLEDLPQADESGFFEKDRVRYGPIRTWASELQISTTAIKFRIEGGKPYGYHLQKNKHFYKHVHDCFSL